MCVKACRCPNRNVSITDDLLNPLVGEHFRVLEGFVKGFGIIRSAERNCTEAVLLKEGTPVVPTAGEQPQATYKDDGLYARIIGAVDLLLFM